ncbi:MAG TPA: trypsin-like peptidase domain-containing protein [Thermoleophilaceae bacterium]|nr:trypsin-like peptidase domain-containing protein [Thermoleophilaceae bacterium]
MRRAAASLLAVVAIAGCGSDDDDGRKAAPAARGDGPPAEKTRVRVVEGLGGGRFDPKGLYESLGPGVVTVISQYEGGLPARSPAALGSGFVLDGKGYVATNAHVVRGEPPRLERPEAVYVEFADHNRVRATVVGVDLFSDIALLKISPRGLTLTPLQLGSTRGLAVGDPVAAIGSPFGEEQSLSVGVVSALHRSIDSLTNFNIGDAIQTDAAINHGNSGGPLLDQRGDVIGVNSQIQSTGGGGEGVGFAVPVETVKRSLSELRRPPHRVAYAYVGVTSTDLYPQLAERLGVSVGRGALVVKVEPDGPARGAGLSAGGERIEFQGQRQIPVDGDVIVAIDGRRVRDSDDVGQAIARHRPGETVELEVVRGDKRRTVRLELGARPDRPPDE